MVNPSHREKSEPPDEGVVRVVLTADNHLSASLPRLSPARQAERRKRLQEAFLAAVEGAIARRAHLFLHAGDLFDTVEPRNRDRAFVARQLARLRAAGIRVYAVSGNHDTPRQRASLGGIAPQAVYSQLDGLHYVAGQHALRPVALDIAGVRIALVGLSSDPTAAPGADPLDSLTLRDPEDLLSGSAVGILLLHAAIEGYCFPSEEEAMVRRASLAALVGIHVVLTGHVHAYTRATVGGKSVVVCGATENMEFGHAEGSPGYAYLEITRTGLRHAEHVPIAPQPRHVVVVNTSEIWPHSEASADAIPEDDGLHPIAPTDVIIARLASACAPDAMVRLALEGTITREQYHELDVQRLWLYGHQRAFSFEVDESSLVLVSEGTHEVVARGERVAPRAMLERVFRERLVRLDGAHTDGGAAANGVLLRARDRVLEGYDELVGVEERA